MEDCNKSSSNHGSRNMMQRSPSGSDKENHDPQNQSIPSASATGFETSFPTSKPPIKQYSTSITPPPSRPAPAQQRPSNFLFEAPQTTIDAMVAKSEKIVESYNVFSGPRLGYQTPFTSFMGAGHSGERGQSSVTSPRDTITSTGTTAFPQTATSADYQLRPSLKVNRLIFDFQEIVSREHVTPVDSNLQRSDSIDSLNSQFAEGGNQRDFSPRQNDLDSGTPVKGRKRGRRGMEEPVLDEKKGGDIANKSGGARGG